MEPQELSQRIGQRIRAERKRLGWTQVELSERTHGVLSQSRIGNYEQGARRPGIEAARLLAETFATVRPEWLLCLDQFPGLLSPSEAELLACFRATDSRGQRRILNVARAVREASSTAEGGFACSTVS
ncbi:helix-turn-helix transcriptional regulator [Thiocystis violacea]|uniref:helix-turn-helix domain-containing protein n=1 Tax=Thiocystis violacea TaxID=13725 RepID=UPI0030B8E4EC